MIEKENFRVESIGKKMPYASPSAEFFEEFTARTIQHIEQSKQRRVAIRRTITTITSIAAMVAVALSIHFMPQSSKSIETLASFDTALDRYVDNLSDEDLTILLCDMEINEAFYSNL